MDHRPGPALADRARAAGGRNLRRAANGLRLWTNVDPPEVGATPRSSSGAATAASCGATPATRHRIGRPILIVPSVLNRSRILDLQPRTSLVRSVLDADLDTFMLDWGEPDEGDADRDLAGYVELLTAAIASDARRVRCVRGGAVRLLHGWAPLAPRDGRRPGAPRPRRPGADDTGRRLGVGLPRRPLRQGPAPVPRDRRPRPGPRGTDRPGLPADPSQRRAPAAGGAVAAPVERRVPGHLPRHRRMGERPGPDVGRPVLGLDRARPVAGRRRWSLPRSATAS